MATMNFSPMDAAIRAENRARRFWVSFIVLILGANLSMGFFAVYLAVGDPSLAVIPNYYEQGLKWDDRKAELAASERLGWSIALAVLSPDSNAQREIAISVTDPSGKAVTGLHGEMKLYHLTNARNVQEVHLRELSPGQYRASAVMPQEGNWQFDVELSREDAKFIWSKEQSVSPSKESSAR